MPYFFEQMRGLLGARYSEFTAAYNEKPRHKALRVNTKKISVEEFKDLAAFYQNRGVNYDLKPNPLCAQSFYTAVKPSTDPLYHAGLYYMQEPSASAAVAAFAPFIGERVLDLCAAPGGKSTQAAAFMRGGVIFCNDVENKRTSALIENIERLGVDNAVVTRGVAADFVKAGLEGYFDTVIVDAPCSGGGMMRYETVPYTPEIVSGCATRQREILKHAADLLASGGYMLYSTCTFAPQEDEDNVGYLTSLGLVPVDTPLLPGMERGIDCFEARRIYPHNFDGEGHFFCVLRKPEGEAPEKVEREKKGKTQKLEFGNLRIDAPTVLNAPILRDLDLPRLKNLLTSPMYVMRVGVPVLSADGREPSHALTHALTREQAELFGTVDVTDRAREYIAGAELSVAAEKGYRIATVDGYALGLAKSANNGVGERVLKNLYPKKLRS